MRALWAHFREGASPLCGLTFCEGHLSGTLLLIAFHRNLQRGKDTDIQSTAPLATQKADVPRETRDKKMAGGR